ncbi:MAG: hypothetical protein M3680_28000 [Myxococcota bacterium]|nr:hypothetical protein [Myxococcota bacterium]
MLALPPAGDLRPTGMATVAVGITSEDGIENVTTTPLDEMRFDAGDVPLGEPIRLRVELRDNTNRLVAFGLVEDAILPDRSEQTITIPVRKPIVYVSSDRPVGTLDPTFDGLDPKFQGTLGSTAGATAFAIDGSELAVISGTSLHRIATADHSAVGSPIELGTIVVSDATRVPGERRLVVASSEGAAPGVLVVDLDSGEVRKLTPMATARVAIAGSAATGFTVYALGGRVAPPVGTASCTGSSMVVAVALDAPAETPAPIATGQFSDLAASGDAVFGSNPCNGMVTRLDPGLPKVMVTVGGAAALATEGSRLWIAGSAPKTMNQGARIRISSVRLDGTDPQEVTLPPKAEVMTYDFDQASELSLNIHADTLVPLDLAVLPGAQSVALITQMNSHRAARVDNFGSKVIPEMDAVVHDIVIADPQAGSISQRIRSRCVLTLINRTNAEFPDWSCIMPSGAETPLGGPSIPRTVGALYGGS